MNKIERLKSSLLPIEYYKKLKYIDFTNINEDDRFYLKNFGIYNIKLKPNHYMLRVRVDCGVIGKEQLRHIANVAIEYDLKILLTARAQIELHQILHKDILQVYNIVNSKLTTWQTLTDNFRAIVCSEYDTVNSDIYCYPIVKEIQKEILKNPEFVGTIPRKFNTAIIGQREVGFNIWSNDLLFALAKKDDTFGFNIYLGGKNSEVAKSVDIFCKKDEVKELFISIARLFNRYGSRGSRSKLRLYFLIQEFGINRVRELIESESGKTLSRAGELLVGSSSKFKEPFYTKAFGKFGEITAKEILDVTERYEKFKLSPNQKLLAIDETKKAKKSEHIELTSCAGSRYCPLSLWDIKSDLEPKVLEFIKQNRVSLGFSGCLKGCGKHFHANIGLIGLRTNLYAPTEKALRVFIGSVQSPTPAPARLLYYSVPKRVINSLLMDIFDDFRASDYSSFEEFSYKVLNRYSIEFLQLWYLLRGAKMVKDEDYKTFLKVREDELLKRFEIKDDINREISNLAHKIWDKNEN